MDVQEIRAHFNEVREDYAPVEGIWSEDEEKVAAIKRIISEINQVDRTIILLYADCQSFRTLGKMLGVSHMTARKEVMRIRQMILDIYERRRIQRG